MRSAATRERDLQTGVSPWMTKRPRLPAHSRLIRDLETEVLVVGAGVSGAFVAELLSTMFRVVVIDRRGPARGSTAASTALVEYEIDTPLSKLASRVGNTNAVRAWRRSHLAVHSLAARTKSLGIRCDMEQCPTLYLAGGELDGDALAEESRRRLAAGIETSFLSRKSLRERFGIDRQAALLTHGDFTADPRKLALGYLATAVERGANLFFAAEAAEIEEHRNSVAVKTTDGPVITAKSIVYCTGYEVPYLVPAKGHRIVSTYAIATRPQPSRLWPERCSIWEASDPYLYVRTTPDGRVLCGGEDEPFSDPEARDALIAAKASALRRKLGKLLPRLDTHPRFAWTGSFGITENGLPLIGRVPGTKHVFAVLGFGGNGTTYARVGADIIFAELADRPDPDADLFAFPA